MNTVDIEKKFLVIHRDMDGKFHHFRWYSAKKVDLEAVKNQISKWNEAQQKKEPEESFPVELITDQLVREICAYKENGKVIEEIINDAKGIQKCIDNAIDDLESSIEILRTIRGLEL